MNSKKKKYKKIDDLIFDEQIVTTLYNKTHININIIEETQDITVDYSGSFFDILGASFDLINGVINEYLPEIDYEFWRMALYDIKTFDYFVKSKYDGLKCKGYISFKVDETQNIDMKFSSNMYGNVKMINYFIEDFCKKYNIDKKEYFKYLDGSHKYFVEGEYAKKMRRRIFK